MKKTPAVSPCNVNELTARNHRALKLFITGKSVVECAGAIKVSEEVMQKMVERYATKSPSYHPEKNRSPWSLSEPQLRFHVVMYFVRMNLRAVECRTVVDFNRSLVR